MSSLLITGLALMGLAFILSIFAGLGAIGNMQKGVTGKQDFDKTFNNHLGSMKRLLLLGIPWVVGIVITVIAVVRDYVLPALGN